MEIFGQTIGGEMTWAAVVQAAASIIGFIFISVQLVHLIRSIRGATQDRLYAQYTEICKLFLQNPHLRPYFYENKTLTDSERASTPRLAQEIDFMSEAILGLIEHAVLQKKNLPGDAWKHCWLPYTRERVAKSDAMRKFFQTHKGCYAKALCKEMRRISAKRKVG